MRICQFFGLAPISFNRRTQKWQQNAFLIYLSVAIIFVHIVVLIGTIIFNGTFVDHKKKSILALLTAFKLAWNYVHALCVVLELLLKRHQQMKLFNMLETLAALYKQQLNMHVDYIKLIKINRQIIIVWICEILVFVMADIFYYLQYRDMFIIVFILAFTPSYAISKLSYGYSIILVSLINEYMVVLNVYMKSITKQHGYYIKGNFINKSKSKKINCIEIGEIELQTEMILFMKNAYSKLWKGTVSIKYQMHFCLAIGLFNEFMILIFNAYWDFLQLFVRASHWSNVLVQTVSILCLLAQILFVTMNYRKAVLTVSQSGNKI